MKSRLSLHLHIIAYAAVWFGCHLTAQAQAITVNSFAQLRAVSSLSNETISLAPGEYWIDGSVANDSYLTLSGSNTAYDFSQAEIKIDTRDLAGHGSPLDVMHISGSNLTINGLTLSGHDVDVDIDPDARRYSNRSANYLRISGDSIELNDAHVITAGSNPYGFGDAFGKGAPPPGRDLPPGEGGVAYKGHNKTSGVLLNGWGTGAMIDGLDLDMFTFGHGVYIQGFDDIEIRNSTVTGQLFSSNDVINDPLYQEYGVNVYGQEMYPDILISGSEDGIRYYGDGNNLDWSENLIIDNVEVTNMREAFSLIAARGTVTVNDARAYGNETGFEPGLGTVITNSEADVTNGPLLYYRRDYVDNTNVEIKLVGDVSQVGRDWDIAYINGENNTVTLTSDIDPNLLSDDSAVRVGQRFNDWRHAQGGLDDTSLPANGVTVNNHTGQVTVLGTNGDNVSGYSLAGTINTGDSNFYDGLTLVLPGTRMVLTSTVTLGNNGTAADGSLETNASIVNEGATLELSPGIQINNEKLTITGNGVDGHGALFTEGQTGSGTRFGSSSNSNESTIFLGGDASIGVGVAGNQLLVGRIQGTGNLTKLGPGKLSMEKSNTFTGDLIVAEGSISARPGAVNHGLEVHSGALLSAIGGNMLNSPDGVATIDGTLDLNSRTDGNTLSNRLGSLSGDGLVTSTNPFNGAGAVLELLGDSGESDYAGQITGAVSLVKSGDGSQALSGSLTHTGTTAVLAGSLLINGVHTGGDAYNVAGGTLGGNGSIDANIVIDAGGTLAPGASVGQLTVEKIVFMTGASLEIEISDNGAGTDHDLLMATDMTLAGDLSVSLLDLGGGLFLPDSMDTFYVIAGSSIAGEFENAANGARIDTTRGEGSFQVTYTSMLVSLSDFIPNTTSGDFDFDGDVDGADFLTWQRGGLAVSELADWQFNYGTLAANAAASTVPEPTNIASCVLVVTIALSNKTLSHRKNI